MKRFCIKIIIFILALFLIDRALFLLLRVNRPSDYEEFLEAKKTFFEQDYQSEILIFGDSHISDALDTHTIEKLTGLSSFNLGIYHSSPYETYFTIKEALSTLKKPPLYTIMGTNPEMFYNDNNIGIYTPLIIGDRIDMILNSKDKFGAEVFFKSIKEKPLFKHLFNKAIGRKYTPTRKIAGVHHGFLKHTNTLLLDSLKWNSFSEFDSTKVYLTQIEYFIRSIQLLQEKQVTVYIVHPPIYKDSNFRKTDSFYAFLRKRMKNNEIITNLNTFPFQGYQMNYYEDKNFFLNPTHLNYKGANKFTTDFCQTYLPNNPSPPSQIIH